MSDNDLIRRGDALEILNDEGSLGHCRRRIEELEAERDDYAFRLADANNTYSEMHVALLDAIDKLAKAVEALASSAEQHRIVAGMDLIGASAVAYNAARAAESTLAELSGEK